MKPFFLAACLAAFLPFASAQTLPDTLAYHKSRFRFTYQGDKIKRPKPLGELLLREPDPQLRATWQNYKGAHGAAIGIEVLGAGLMGASLVQTAQGKESNTLLLAGAGTMLVGALVDGFVATPLAKKAARRYNDVKMNRLPVDPPIPTVFKTVPDTTAPLPAAAPQTPRPHPVAGAKTALYDPATYYGLAMGLGWSKQKINYAFAFDEDYRAAQVFSFGLFYGGRISDRLGWQLEFGLTQHGYRLASTDNGGGVKIRAKADARLRYFEAPFLLVYRFPTGKKGLELSAMPGLGLGYAVSAKVVSRSRGESEDQTVRIRVTDKIPLKEADFGERLDAALLLGLRASQPLGPGRVFVETRYHFGILNLERDAEFSITEGGDKAFNRSLLLRVGYLYGL